MEQQQAVSPELPTTEVSSYSSLGISSNDSSHDRHPPIAALVQLLTTDFGSLVQYLTLRQLKELGDQVTRHIACRLETEASTSMTSFTFDSLPEKERRIVIRSAESEGRAVRRERERRRKAAAESETGSSATITTEKGRHSRRTRTREKSDTETGRRVRSRKEKSAACEEESAFAAADGVNGQETFSRGEQEGREGEETLEEEAQLRPLPVKSSPLWSMLAGLCIFSLQRSPSAKPPQDKSDPSLREPCAFLSEEYRFLDRLKLYNWMFECETIVDDI